MSAALAIFGLCAMFVVGFYVGVRMSARTLDGRPELAEEMVESNGMAAYDAKATEPIDPFPVARSDRRPTWRERRRELEAAARTKRKAYEEWRD